MAEIFKDIFKTKPYAEPEPSGSITFTQSSLNTITYPEIDLPETDFAPFADYGKDAKNIRTIPYTGEKEPATRTSVHQLGPGDFLELNSIRYQILNIVSGEGKTSEAIIYKVKNDSGKVFALKLYYEFYDEHLEPNPDTLQRIREIGGKDILHLFDFGTGPNKYLGKFCFEISDYALGGDLLSVASIHAKYTPEFIQNVVITGINNGILALHKEKIFHCDLKPQNVFFLDIDQTSIVIGDYGSAKSFEKSSEKELSHTTITKGTEFYLAPEQAFGIVSVKNDFYSLGMIVLHLLYPEKVTKTNLRKIFERRTKGIQIIDFDPKYGRLNQLIEGLTLQDYNNRWGAEEINNWLDGQDVNVNYATHGPKNYIKLNDNVIKTGTELANYIEAGNSFYEELIEDKDGYSVLLTWINHLQGNESRQLFERMVSYYKKNFGIEYVREAILFFFNPTREIKIGNASFNFNNQLKLSENIATFFARLDSMWKIADLDSLRFCFFQFEFAVRQIRVKSPREIVELIDNTFLRISGIIGSDYQPDFSDFRAKFYIDLRIEHFVDLFYAFIFGRGFKDTQQNQLKTLNEVCDYFESHPQMYQQKLMKLEKRGFLHQVTPEEFIQFISKSEHCFDFLLKRTDDFNLLTDVVSNFVKDRFSREFVQSLLDFYLHDDLLVFREAVCRLIQPDQPVRIGNEEIHFYKKGDFNNKVKYFFHLLDKEWKKVSFNIISARLFSFEFSLLLIAREDKVAFKSMIKPVFDKAGVSLNTSHGNMNTLQCQFYKMVAKENIFDLLYQFLPNRPFRQDSLELNTIEEIGFFYLKNPSLFNDIYSHLEREAFFKFHNFKSLSGLNYEDFILKVFRSKATLETEIVNIIFDEPAVNEFTVVYNYIISLNEFLKNEGYTESFTTTSKEPQQIVINGGEFVNPEVLYERFTKAVLHKIRVQDFVLIGNSKASFLQNYKKKNKLEYNESFHYIPKYLLFLFPVFGLLFYSVNYLVDQSVFRAISYSISPTFNLLSVRLARSYFSVLLLSAYSLNFLVALFLLLPLHSLSKNRENFNNFFQYYGSLINKVIMYFIFSPIMFIIIYFIVENIISGISGHSTIKLLSMNLEHIAVYLYIIFMTTQVLQIVTAFFKSFKKFRIMPFVISVAIYILIGFLTLGYQNFNPAGKKSAAYLNHHEIVNDHGFIAEFSIQYPNKKCTFDEWSKKLFGNRF